MPTTYRLASPTPPNATGQAALAIIELQGDIDATLRALNIAPIATGETRLRAIKDIDTLVIVRITPTAALLFPHASPAIVHRLEASLDRIGCTRGDRASYPESATTFDKHLADALARAASPLAIDLLLAQPARWTAAAADPSRRLPPQASAALRRLIDPPLVVALGPPNIGKSSLLNALAGRSVSIVADQPGTTRDHVGVQLDLAGLVVRYADTPGLHETPDTPEGHILAEAQAAAMRLAHSADLVLLCHDATTSPLSPPGLASTLRLALRADLARSHHPADTHISAHTGEGLVPLVTLIRERLVPNSLLNDPRAWDFFPTDQRSLA